MKLYLFYFDYEAFDKDEKMLSYFFSFFNTKYKKSSEDKPESYEAPPRYMLYGIADNKRDKKIFENTRDMTKFREKTITVTEGEYEVYATDYDYCFIKDQELHCRYTRKDGVPQYGKVRIPITNFEIETMVYESIGIFSDRMSELDSRMSIKTTDMIRDCGTTIFIPEIQKVFETILMDHLFGEDWSWYPDVIWEYYANMNELYTYMEVYGCTYRKGGIARLCEYGNFT